MPTLNEERATLIEVAPSGPLELMWVLHFLESTHACEGPFSSLEALRQRFGPELTALRSDGLSQYSTELVVLAHRSETLFYLDPGRFFDRLAKAASDASELPSLRSEKPAERRIVRERLERLRSDRGFRRRYTDLLSTVWQAVEPEWRDEGRGTVLAETRRWTDALDNEGFGYKNVLGLSRLWPGRPDLDDMADAAAAEGKLTLNPCWFGGKVHMLELDGAVLVGRGIRLGEPSYRKVAAEVANRMRALADPTRLTILLRLAHQPASVTEIARQLKLAQPTVSAHVQVLRDAGLLEERTVGRSAELSASEEGLHRLLAGSEESMLKLFR
jgi:DNA-binding transcriptional ArsR family regulator